MSLSGVEPIAETADIAAASSKHLIGFRRGRRKAVFLFVAMNGAGNGPRLSWTAASLTAAIRGTADAPLPSADRRP
jgi:hypothetical protein